MIRPGTPRDLVLVRHAETEANRLQQAERDGTLDEIPLEVQQAIRDRPDWQQRVTLRGVQQAIAANKWIHENIGDPQTAFDVRYYSPFIRPRETLYYIGGPDSTWRKHDSLIEQDWGEYGKVPRSERAERFPHADRMRKEAPLFAQLTGGEAKAYGVINRVLHYRDALRRKHAGKSVLAVSHGGTIGVFRYVYEDMLPEEWEEIDRDPTKDIGNCALLWYTAANPNDAADIRPYLGWRLMIQPDALEDSPYGGEWCELLDRRERTAAELIESVEKYPRLLID